jgi:cytochrome c peroxidase
MRSAIAALAACGCAASDPAASGAFSWDVPDGFPIPLVPDDNPMSVDKVELGHRLFYDSRLSGNQTFTCASCHDQARAFTDGMAVAIGSTGEPHPRNSMSLANAGYLGRFTWANPLLDDLEQQAVVPMFGFEPVELGLRNLEDTLVERLTAEPLYQDLFPSAFPGAEPAISVDHVVAAIAAFERTLISARSPYDRWQRGERDAISASAQRGSELFKFTQRPADMGKFRVPTLRNIAVTAPYFHDGSAATLDDVLDHYAAAGRTIADGPHAGVGADNPFKSALINGFTLSADERADLHAFFDSLTDTEFLTDSRFADPWH